MKTQLPKFFNYKKEGGRDSGYEALQDFFLSWTLRCAEEKNSAANDELNEYAKTILYALTYGINNEKDYFIVALTELDNFQVIEVNTFRQEKYIDLIVEAKISINNHIQNIVLNIENKWYSNIRINQLEKAKEYINKKYLNKADIISNLVIYPDYEKIKTPSVKQHIRNQEYKFVTIEDLKDICKMSIKGKTNNYLFDEYWFRF